MANLDQFTGTGSFAQPVYATTWTVTDTSTGDNDTVTCTKSAEAGKTHFITFLTTSTDHPVAATGGGIKATLSGASSGDKLHYWPQESDGRGAPSHIDLQSPIQMGENEDVTFSSGSLVSGSQVTFTMGGFTSPTRVS